MGSSGTVSLEVKRTEISEIFTPEYPLVDIVFVHGLNGHPKDTWTKNGVFWPAQLLPKTLNHVQARILTYGYNADVYAFGGKSATSDYIHEHAQTLITTLDAERYNEDATERPIIFVAHSLGGILVKRALDYSAAVTNPNIQNLRSVFVSTYGIIFLGTPHNGADPAKWGKMLQSMCQALLPKKILDTKPQLVDTLKTQSETLQNINIGFANIMDKFHIYLFHEALPTDMGVTREFIVDQTSAGPIMPGPAYAGIEATHSDMCKFESKNSPGYTAVSSTLKRFSQEASKPIAARWSEEYHLRDRRNRFKASELLGFAGVESRLDTPNAQQDNLSQGPSTGASPSPDQSIQSLPPPSTSLAGAEPRAVVSAEATDFAALSEPFFIVPSGFRHNSVFVGMTKELNELDQKLFDVKARASGSARVLVHCLPGGGKSRVAWEYVSTRKDKWPGGIFWIGAKSKSEIAQGFWDIAQKVALEDVEDPRNAQFEKDTEVFINAVKAWFQNRQDWLLVFDGVTIDQEADKAGLQAFIPDNQNSGVIITSVDKSLAGSSEPLSPVAVKVASLSEDEARRLLFLELGVSNPSFAEREKALEIVKKVECLPLAVHTIGHRLRNYGEPLLKYHIKSYPSDSRLKAPFVEIMEDLRRLRHDEARNLINILCFFGQHIPVEMINLGLKALSSPPNRDPAGRPREVQVKAREGGGPRDLNVTFGTLMKYALIERNDPDDAASQSSHPSLTKTIDMLRIHSVVQGFLCDSLKSAGQLPKWLGHAVDMFCWSFREADGRIKGKEGSGLVKDYREYEVHGNRLNEHIKKYQIRFPKLEIVRFELEKALKVVEEEIQKLTPNSSQETLPRKTCQVSVFDRTSSASDAGPETPTRRLSTVSTWGLDIGKAHLDSPVSIGPESPGPTILDYNPHAQLLPFYDEDVGYDSGREQHFAPQDMVASHSQRTARPASTERRLDEQKAVGRDLTLQASFEEDPQMHRTVSARQQRRYRDSVSSWRRIEPKSTDPRVSKITAQRFEARKTKASPTGSHDSGSQAEIALGAFKHAGTAIDPPLIETHSGKGRQSSSSSISPSQLLARLGSYAEVLRGRTGKTPTTVEEPVPSPDLEENYAPSVSFIPRAQSDGSSPNRENNERPPPSPLASGPSALQPASQSLPPQNSGMAARHTRDSQSLSPHSSPGLKYAQPMRTSDPDLRHLLQQGSIEEHLSMPQSGQAFRRNPAPLPFEDISAGSKRLLPQDFRGHGHQGMVYYVPASSSSLHNMPPSSAYTHSSYPYGPDDSYISRPQPTGYTSQPMSRHPSGQSAIGMQSVTGTEPARFPPQFSPPLGSGPLSPRARHRDGAPMRKSPKLQAVHAFPKSPSVIDATPRYAGDEAFTAIGDWAGVHGSTSMNMSRSSSGPGIAANGGIIKFGDQPPLDLANENWGEDEEFLPVRREDFQQAFARGLFRMDRGRPRRPLWESVASAPYPDTSQMPRTGSDLQAMMREEQRRRGLSAPMPPAPHVGYGVDLSRSVPGQESTHSG